MYNLIKKYQSKILWISGILIYGYWFCKTLYSYISAPEWTKDIQHILGSILASGLITFLYGSIYFSIVLILGCSITTIHNMKQKSIK